MTKLFNLAKVTTATMGTGSLKLGGATPGFLTFAQAGVSDGDTVSYVILDVLNSATEIGHGTYSSIGPTLTRNVLRSTNAGSAIYLSGSAIVFITMAAEDFVDPLSSAATWSVVVAAAAVNPAVPKTLYEVTGAAAPFTITLPSTAAKNDAVAVYIRDFTSTIIVTVDAGAGGAISDFGQTHRIGVQHSFFVYRCVSPLTWIVEWSPCEKELRYRASNTQVGILHGNSLLYVDSIAGARTVTVPSNTTDPLPVGFQTEVMRYGANDVTLVADVGVTIDSDGPLGIPKQFSRGVLTKINPNEWTWNIYGYSSQGSRIITASPDTPTYTDDTLFINLTIAGICTINFPSVASRNGRPLRVKDIAGSALTYNHVMARNGTDVFEGGATSFTFYSNYQGQTFIPVTVGGVGTWAVM